MDQLTLLLNAAFGIVASAVLGGTKKFTGLADMKIGGVIKPVQPLLVMALAWGLPKLGAAIGLVPPDAAALVDAPTATIAGIVSREVLSRLTGQKKK